MNKIGMYWIGIFTLVFSSFSFAQETTPSTEMTNKEKKRQHIENRAVKNCAEGDQACVDQKQTRMLDKKKEAHEQVQEHCKGDAECEAKTRKRLDEKRGEVLEKMKTECAENDRECKKNVSEQMKNEWKEERQAKVADHREERRQKIESQIQERCKGEQACLDKAHQRLETRKGEINEAIKAECPDGKKECKKEVSKRINAEWNARKEEEKQSKKSSTSEAISSTPAK